MANILILGAGSMGTAFSFPCYDKNHSVTIVGTHLENDFIEKISNSRKHPALDKEIPKDVKFLKFEKLEEEIKKNKDLIVVATTSNGIEWASIELSKYIKIKSSILILTKGLSLFKNKYEVLAHKMQRILKKNSSIEINIIAAGGPCLAKGLANRVHTSVVYASENMKIANKIAQLVSTDYYHVVTSNDVVGVEVSAAIKNIFSMAIGAAEGLCGKNISKEIRKNNFLNTAASLLQQSIHEMSIFVEKLNGKNETVMGLAGVGDLYVSADGGRNSQMGYYIGQGMSFEEAKKAKMPNLTVEGAELIFEIGSKVKSDFNIETLPLMISMINTIVDKKPLLIDWDNFKYQRRP